MRNDLGMRRYRQAVEEGAFETTEPEIDDCDPSIATVCEHDPKSATFMLSCTGRIVVERKMCNGATDVSMADGRDMIESEWEEYCQTVIPARWRTN